MVLEQEENACSSSAMGRSCTLMITHRCNLDCTYCYESHKSPDKEMPIALAKEIVEKEFDLVARSEEFSELCIDFMGGEPLLRFDMIAELAEWIWASPRPAPYILYATTNGTLLDDKKKAWFEKHKEHFYLGLSLDGAQESQEKNRKGSFSRIDIDFFRRIWPKQEVKMTISPETLPTLATDVVYLHESGFAFHFNPAHGVAWSEKDAAIYEEQLSLLAEYYLEHNNNIVPVEMLTLNFAGLLQKETTIRKFCGTGTHMITYDVDGKSYPCHMFAPIVVGQDRSDDLKRFDFHVPDNLLDPKCATCPLLQICPTCYGFNYKYRNDIALRDQDYCRMYKRQVKVACQFQLDRILQKGMPTTTDEMTQAKVLLHSHDLLQELVCV